MLSRALPKSAKVKLRARCDVTTLGQVGNKAELTKVEATLRDEPSIDMLVNNAGTASVAPLLNADVAKMDDMIALNVTALTRLTYAVRQFRARGPIQDWRTRAAADVIRTGKDLQSEPARYCQRRRLMTKTTDVESARADIAETVKAHPVVLS